MAVSSAERQSRGERASEIAPKEVDRSKPGEAVSDGYYETHVWQVENLDNPHIPVIVKRLGLFADSLLRKDQGWRLTRVIAGVLDLRGLQQTLVDYLSNGPSDKPPQEFKLGFQFKSPRPPRATFFHSLVWATVSDIGKVYLRELGTFAELAEKARPTGIPGVNNVKWNSSLFGLKQLSVNRAPFPTSVFDNAFDDDKNGIFVSVVLEDQAFRLAMNVIDAQENLVHFKAVLPALKNEALR